MNWTVEDEWTLARLTAAKLARIMHGWLSVGAASLGTDLARDFLQNKDHTPLGFLEVLGCMGVGPGHENPILPWRQRVKELAELTSQFHGLFLGLAGWRSMSRADIQDTVRCLGECYTLFCRRLGEFGFLLGMQLDLAQQAKEDSNYLAAVVQRLVTQAGGGAEDAALLTATNLPLEGREPA